MSSSFVRSYLVRNEQLIRVAWLASFPGSTDQLFFARSEKKVVSRAWERGYCMGVRKGANRAHEEASYCLKNGTRYSSKYKACDFLTPENLHFLL